MCLGCMCVDKYRERQKNTWLYIAIKYRIWAVVRCRRMSVNVTWWVGEHEECVLCGWEGFDIECGIFLRLRV